MRDTALGGHRVRRVGEQVDEDLRELPGDAAHGRELGVELPFEPDGPDGELVLAKYGSLVDHFSDLNRPRNLR